MMDPLILDVEMDVALARAFPTEITLTDVVDEMPDDLAALLAPRYGRRTW